MIESGRGLLGFLLVLKKEEEGRTREMAALRALRVRRFGLEVGSSTKLSTATPGIPLSVIVPPLSPAAAITE